MDDRGIVGGGSGAGRSGDPATVADALRHDRDGGLPSRGDDAVLQIDHDLAAGSAGAALGADLDRDIGFLRRGAEKLTAADDLGDGRDRRQAKRIRTAGGVAAAAADAAGLDAIGTVARGADEGAVKAVHGHLPAGAARAPLGADIDSQFQRGPGTGAVLGGTGAGPGIAAAAADRGCQHGIGVIAQCLDTDGFWAAQGAGRAIRAGQSHVDRATRSAGRTLAADGRRDIDIEIRPPDGFGDVLETERRRGGRRIAAQSTAAALRQRHQAVGAVAVGQHADIVVEIDCYRAADARDAAVAALGIARR